MKIIAQKPFKELSIYTKYHRIKKTIAVYEYLDSIGYKPAGLSDSLITMTRSKFTKLIKNEVKGQCLVYTDKNWRINSVWVDFVEISFVEQIKKDFVLIEDWSPLL